MAYLETFWDSANDFFVQIKKSAQEHVETTTIVTTVRSSLQMNTGKNFSNTILYYGHFNAVDFRSRFA